MAMLKCGACGYDIDTRGEAVDHRGHYVTHRERVRCVELLRAKVAEQQTAIDVARAALLELLEPADAR